MIERFVSLDLEMTGLNPKLDKIIEIGAVRVVQGEITERFSCFVNPGVTLDGHITELTGITDSDVRGAKPIGEILPKLLAFLGEDVLVGHRIMFDYSFVKKAATDEKQSFVKKGIDTLRLSRAFLPELEKKTLESVCEFYRIPLTAHRALGDAEATAKLYLRLEQDFYEKEPKLFAPTELLFKVKKDSPATKAQREQIARWYAGHNKTPEFDISMLKRSEAGRIITRIHSASEE